MAVRYTQTHVLPPPFLAYVPLVLGWSPKEICSARVLSFLPSTFPSSHPSFPPFVPYCLYRGLARISWLDSEIIHSRCAAPKDLRGWSSRLHYGFMNKKTASQPRQNSYKVSAETWLIFILMFNLFSKD